jgi:peptide/nickel transport system substrate-binding protein
LNFRFGWTIALALSMLASACASGTTLERASQGPQTAPSAPKVLTIGISDEPKDFYGFGGINGGGISQVPPIALDTLVYQTGKGEFLPLLATEQISLEKGTWRVNPDGSMDTTWKLKPGVKWHDGTPFTADDMVFSITARKDPAVAARNFGRLDLVQSVAAPDPLTFTMHWSSTYADANRAVDMEPFPKHLFEETYLTQKENFANSPYLTHQFIGTGPYRLAEWQSGSHMTFTRFEEYHQGRPPLDRVTVRFLGDSNAMVAYILSGNVDIPLPNAVNIDAAAEIQQRWAGTGNEVRFDLTDGIQKVEVQFRPEVARPKEGLATNVLVRQAFYHAIDRTTLVETVARGIPPLADSWISPKSALRPALESSIPQYPYDPARAQQLLAQAGWVRGGDGTLMNSATGEKFESELWTTNPEDMKPVAVIASQWRTLGAQIGEYGVPAGRSNDREHAASYPLGFIVPGEFVPNKFLSHEIRSAATRWIGQNRPGYANPRVDDLVDRLAVSIDTNERLTVQRELLQAAMGDVMTMPLYWGVAPVLQLKGVRSHETVSAPATISTWNFFDYDKE